jgi:hypothetical protein
MDNSAYKIENYEYSIWRVIAPLATVTGVIMALLHEFFGPEPIGFGGGEWVGRVSLILLFSSNMIYIWFDYPVIKKIVKTRFASSIFAKIWLKNSAENRENRGKIR